MVHSKIFFVIPEIRGQTGQFRALVFCSWSWRYKQVEGEIGEEFRAIIN